LLGKCTQRCIVGGAAESDRLGTLSWWEALREELLPDGVAAALTSGVHDPSMNFLHPIHFCVYFGDIGVEGLAEHPASITGSSPVSPFISFPSVLPTLQMI
jgi:hypothetical protein